MKKLLCGLLAACLLLALAGCSSGAASDDSSEYSLEGRILTDDSSSSSSSPAYGTGGINPAAPGAATGSSVGGGGASLAPKSYKLTIPEGYTLARIGMTLEEKGVCTAAEFIAATQNGDFTGYSLVGQQPYNENRCFTLEGYLFPATYDFLESATPDDIIRTMVNTLEKRMTQELRDAAATSGYSVDQILTIASIIEKEAKGTEVMPLISSVLHNRLNSGMQLQCDVTITYVEGAIKPFIEGDKDRYNSYYNTYKCAALPAGPICNPGMAAINAALYPASTNYLYFLSDSNDQFHFAATFEEHQANRAATGV